MGAAAAKNGLLIFFTIHFIITGGTIDSFYDGSKDTAVPNKESIIPSFIKSLKLYHGAEFTTVCMKDSRDLKREDLENVLKTIEKSSHDKIIVTHGTYTMPDTARFIKGNIKRDDQTIILTASAIPIQGFLKRSTQKYLKSDRSALTVALTVSCLCISIHIPKVYRINV